MKGLIKLVQEKLCQILKCLRHFSAGLIFIHLLSNIIIQAAIIIVFGICIVLYCTEMYDLVISHDEKWGIAHHFCICGTSTSNEKALLGLIVLQEERTH